MNKPMKITSIPPFITYLALCSLPIISSSAFATELSADTIIVTGNKTVTEQRSTKSATIWVIDEEQIRKSNADSITNLLANSATGFFSEWTPGQTSINLRGGASDGQGKDFKSQVMVLINGRRAGTANLSKLSPNDIRRIEIMRGPVSVAYGSQAIGGIINLILKNGRNSEGVLLDARVGSAALTQLHAETANIWDDDEKFASFFSGSWGRKSDYHGGKHAGKQVNTQWRRFSGLADLSWQPNQQHHFQLTMRNDGIYNVGFRGSGANRYAKDDRINRSIDVNWNFTPDEMPIKWNLHNYFVYDEDYFKWSSPKAGTSKDHNKRKLHIMGLKFQPTIAIYKNNDLMLGIDLEQAKLRSERDRLSLTGKPMPINPQDINQTERTFAVYAEDTQRLFNDRLILRAGARYNWGNTSADATPNLAGQTLATESYHKTTWSVGANFHATEFMTLRAGAATGFRAPTATEMSGEVSFLNTPHEVTYGNPQIKPETNQQYEVGVFFQQQDWFTDIALFHNQIKNRIIRERINSAKSLYVNNSGDIVISGLELDSRINFHDRYNLDNWHLSLGLNASYNFNMKDKARTQRNRQEPDRIYRYQSAFYTQFGQRGASSLPWSVRLTGILRGPVYYDTEERLQRPQFEPNAQFIHRKPAFMIWNLNGEINLNYHWTSYFGINNLFNKNQHPLFIAINNGKKYLTNPNDGGYGTSMPGREFYVGFKYTF